jgi:hypothetical protein
MAIGSSGEAQETRRVWGLVREVKVDIVLKEHDIFLQLTKSILHEPTFARVFIGDTLLLRSGEFTEGSATVARRKLTTVVSVQEILLKRQDLLYSTS